MSLKDVLFGKKDVGTRDRFIDLDPNLRNVVKHARLGTGGAAKLLEKEIYRLDEISPEQRFQAEQAARLRSLKGIAEDSRRRASQEVAKRGLGRSSVGLQAILQADERARERIADVQAMAPVYREEAAARRVGDIKNVIGGLQGILSSPGPQKTFVQGRQGQGRSGGLLGALLPAAGMAGGAYLGAMTGNPVMAGQGAQMGGQMGGNLAGAISGTNKSALGPYWQSNPYAR